MYYVAVVTYMHRVYNLYATDIMRKDLTFLSYESSFSDLQELLQTSEHASYPLVDAPSKSALMLLFTPWCL